MVRIWADKFQVKKTKYIRALNTDIIIIERESIPRQNSYTENRQAKSGLYFIEVDFNALEPTDGKLSDYILSHQDDLKPIVEYSLNEYLELYLWDARGTPETMAIAYVLEKDRRFSLAKLVAASDLSGQFRDCDVIDDCPRVKHLEMISPPDIPGRVYTLYSTVNGLDGGVH
ncbi:MAG: hypothetical protein AB7U98_14865 [Candidatus Nitrosocosmicus sp.]